MRILMVGLELNGPVNSIKVISSRSVFLTILFLGRLSPLKRLTSTCALSFIVEAVLTCTHNLCF